MILFRLQEADQEKHDRVDDDGRPRTAAGVQIVPATQYESVRVQRIQRPLCYHSLQPLGAKREHIRSGSSAKRNIHCALPRR